jgi:hypothetical protein
MAFKLIKINYHNLLTDKVNYLWRFNNINYFHFIHQRLYSLLLGPDLFFSFVIFFFTQTVGLLGRGIRLSQGRYLHTGQHKHGINAHTNSHALSGIRTHDPNIQVNEDSSCLRLGVHFDRQYKLYTRKI